MELNNNLNEFAKIIGKDNLELIKKKHLDVIDYLFLILPQNNLNLTNFKHFYDLINEDDFEDKFLLAIKRTLIYSYIPEIIEELPKEVSSLNFELVSKINDISELNNKHLILKQSYINTIINNDNVKQNIFLLNSDTENFLNKYLNEFLLYLENELSDLKDYDNFKKVFVSFIVKEKIDYREISGNFREYFSYLFLDDNIDEEIKDKYYKREYTSENFLNDDINKYFKNTDIVVCLMDKKYYWLIGHFIGNQIAIIKNYPSDKENAKMFQDFLINNEKELAKKIDKIIFLNQYSDINELQNENIVIYDEKVNNVIEKLGKDNILKFENETNFFNESQTFSMFITYVLNTIDDKKYTYENFKELVKNYLINTNVNYSFLKNSNFRKEYANLFLTDDAPLELQQKFYEKILTIDDLYNESWHKYLENIDIACALPKEYKFISMINVSLKLKIEILKNYNNIDPSLKSIYVKALLKKGVNITFEDVSVLTNLLNERVNTNSLELRVFRDKVAEIILKESDYTQIYHHIDEVFINSHLPLVGKLFELFKIINPDYSNFDFSFKSKMSPVLKKLNDQQRDAVIFTDLLRASLGSNNRSIKRYLMEIENGYTLYVNLSENKRKYDELSVQEKDIINIFLKHLITLYNSSEIGKINPKNLSGNPVKDIEELSKLIKVNNKYDLKDRIVRMFAYRTNLKNFEDIKKYMQKVIEDASLRNQRYSTNIKLEKGDFIKGIQDIKFLHNILQNGAIARDFLGSESISDKTPLDTDVSIIEESGSIKDMINESDSSKYGPIYLVLKNRDNRFLITRRGVNDLQPVSEPNDYSKLEVFYTYGSGKSSYGIRTGFASSEIDYILTEVPDQRIFVEIVLNGFYIPVVDVYTEKVIFTKEDYDKLKLKFQGLKYYGFDSYNFSEDLEYEYSLMTEKEKTELKNLVDLNTKNTQLKIKTIYGILSKVMKSFNLELVTSDYPSLERGKVVIETTGSTGRGTNIPLSYDFDFVMSFDESIISNSKIFAEIKTAINKAFINSEMAIDTEKGPRFKGVNLPGLSDLTDIDISFKSRMEQNEYSTNEALNDCLDTIKKISEEKYNLVIYNIMMAKKYLKEQGIYKSRKSVENEGGLSAVGIEHWILQNGGSFKTAINTFLASSQNASFKEFCEKYPVWRYGKSHFDPLPCEEFISSNMDNRGYQNMIKALQDYLILIEQKEDNIRKGETL